MEIGTIEKFNIIPNDLSEKERVLNMVSKDLVAFWTAVSTRRLYEIKASSVSSRSW